VFGERGRTMRDGDKGEQASKGQAHQYS